MAAEREQRDALHVAIAVALRELLNGVATSLAALVNRAGSRGAVNQAGREAVVSWLGSTIARLFGVTPVDAAARVATQGTVPHLIAASTRAAVLIAAPDGGVPPAPEAAVGRWRDPHGLVLSERVWLAGEDARSRITAVLDAGLARGATPDEIATELRRFVLPEVAARTVRGDEAFWNARRLVTHEVNRAGGMAQLAAARGSGARVAWDVSGRHALTDECSNHAASGPYTPDKVPIFPAHLGCLCHLEPLPGEGEPEPGAVDGAALVAALTGFA